MAILTIPTIPLTVRIFAAYLPDNNIIIMKKLAVVIVASTFCPAVSFADNLAVSAKVGSLGFGVELTKVIADNVTGRAGLNAFDYNKNISKSTVNYDMNLQLQTVTAIADWYPSSGIFRTSAGLFYNNNKASLNAWPATGSYVINNVTYAAADVGSMQGNMAFNSLAPYFGIGWGNPVAKDKNKNGGWGFVADIGVMYQGTPRVTLAGTCSAALTIVQCAALKSDISGEQIKLQSALNNFTWYPVVSIGVSYRW